MKCDHIDVGLGLAVFLKVGHRVTEMAHSAIRQQIQLI